MAELDALVRRIDEDRWLASRFANAGQRVRLMALYALNHEIARIAEGVREPALGDIRFAWWRDALTSGGLGGAHPALDSFLELWPEPFATEGILKIIEARRLVDLETMPFDDLGGMERYAAQTAGALIAIAASCCGGVSDELADAAGRAWGLTGMLRAMPYWAARGRRSFPAKVGAGVVSERAAAAFAQAREFSRSAPVSAFAAYGYIALTPSYLRARTSPLLARQLRLVFASARGRI